MDAPTTPPTSTGPGPAQAYKAFLSNAAASQYAFNNPGAQTTATAVNDGLAVVSHVPFVGSAFSAIAKIFLGSPPTLAAYQSGAMAMWNLRHAPVLPPGGTAGPLITALIADIVQYGIDLWTLCYLVTLLGAGTPVPFPFAQVLLDRCHGGPDSNQTLDASMHGWSFQQNGFLPPLQAEVNWLNSGQLNASSQPIHPSDWPYRWFDDLGQVRALLGGLVRWCSPSPGQMLTDGNAISGQPASAAHGAAAWIIVGAQRCWIPDVATMLQIAGPNPTIQHVSTAQLQGYPLGPPVTSIVQVKRWGQCALAYYERLWVQDGGVPSPQSSQILADGDEAAKGWGDGFAAVSASLNFALPTAPAAAPPAPAPAPAAPATDPSSLTWTQALQGGLPTWIAWLEAKAQGGAATPAPPISPSVQAFIDSLTPLQAPASSSPGGGA